MGTDAPVRFSVVMPVWNRAEWIAGAIESVLAQTVEDWELLVIDDGSTDDLLAAMTPYRGHRQVRIVQTPHRGVCAARNEGLRQASGTFIAYLDSDNRWRPRFVERMSQALAGSPKLVAYCDYNLWRRRPLTGRLYLQRTCSPAFDFVGLLRRNSIDINTFVHHRSILDETGLWDEDIERMNDWDFILRVTSRYEPLHLSEALVDYYYGVCENTISRTRKPRPSATQVREKFVRFRRATITHDTITYVWESLPDVKYYNWVKFTQHAIDRESFRASAFPSVLQIEPTNLCNLACPLCPAGRAELGRPLRNMTLEEFTRIVDDTQEYLMLLILWDWGEPFLNPALPEMISYASDRDIRTVTSTNAHFLHDEPYLERVLTSGLRTLIVAVDSLSDESYQIYRKRGKLTLVLDGLTTLVEMKRRLRSRTLINARMVVMRHNEHEVAAVREAVREIGADCFTVKTVNPSCGSHSSDDSIVPLNPRYQRFVYESGTSNRIRADNRCERVWMMSNVFADGSVVPCCYDFDGSMAVGNAFETPFSQLWTSDAYSELRRKILLEKSSIERCRDCHTSFKKARGGDWFIDRVDFNMPFMSTLQYRARKVLRHGGLSQAWRRVHNYVRPFLR